MYLLVDIGNSRIKWTDPQELEQGVVSSLPLDEMQALFTPGRFPKGLPEQIFVSSVADVDDKRLFAESVERQWGLKPTFLETQPDQCGVVNGYADPSQLGIDRWMALIAARAISHQAVIVVDSGTATTIDALDREGKHLGGYILPGIRIMGACLLDRTAINSLDWKPSQGAFAVDTSGGISAASLQATACLIERSCELLSDKTGGPVACLISGGDAAELISLLRIESRHEPDLVLRGVSLVARETAGI
jgi:type III pantothenate kinase